jgi:hypothetical protein
MWQQVALGIFGLAAAVGYVVAVVLFEIPVLPG